MWAACTLAHRKHTALVVAGGDAEPSPEAIAGAILQAETAWAVVQLQKNYIEAHSS